VSVLTFILPSGLGTRDATLATAIDAVLPLTVATAIAVAFRIFQTAVELTFVGLLVLIARRARPAELGERDRDGEHPGAQRERGQPQPPVA
jgi:uncharacterized membrane protein YbhN (UPF0104 family)